MDYESVMSSLLGETIRPPSIGIKDLLEKDLSYINGKRVLITGAGGTIGSELSKQLLFGGARRLYLFNHSENTLFELLRNLEYEIEKNNIKDAKLVPVIGELQDSDYMKFIIDRLNPDVVFHAAAHKHVGLSEENPIETIKNNVFGTLNIVEACHYSNVKKFVLISTDKAVEPIGIYGVSKKLAEEIVLGRKDGRFSAVRFGNVIGSSGSVFHIFKRKIEEGKTIEITDKEAKRFFMSIEEAVSLVLKIGGNGNGLYLLDMGRQVYIEQLARNMMKILGKQVGIIYTGLKHGEKIEESLFDINYEIAYSTDIHPRIKNLQRLREIEKLDIIINKLRPVCYYSKNLHEEFRNRATAREILVPVFPTLKTLDNISEY